MISDSVIASINTHVGATQFNPHAEKLALTTMILTYLAVTGL